MTLSLVTGGAGFIGSNLVDGLLERGDRVRVIDDFSTGRRENLAHLEGDGRVELVEGDICDLALVREACDGVEAVAYRPGNLPLPTLV